MNNTFAMCLTLSLSASFADHRSTLDGADKVPARELAVAQDEKDHDRDLRDYETSSRKVKHRDIAIAVQLQHTDRNLKIPLSPKETQPKQEVLQERDKDERVADDDSRRGSPKGNLPKSRNVSRALNPRGFFNLAGYRGHEAAEYQNLRGHTVYAMHDDQANLGIKQVQRTQCGIKRYEHGLLRQHQTSEEHTDENRLARRLEPTNSECRNQGEQHGKCSTSACIEQAVAH